jgi:hypothetical protein
VDLEGYAMIQPSSSPFDIPIMAYQNHANLSFPPIGRRDMNIFSWLSFSGQTDQSKQNASGIVNEDTFLSRTVNQVLRNSMMD